MKELFSKQAGEDAHRQEEAGPGSDPVLTIRGETSGRDQTVQVRVVLQGLAPGMQDSHKSDLGPEMFGVSGHSQ